MSAFTSHKAAKAAASGKMSKKAPWIITLLCLLVLGGQTALADVNGEYQAGLNITNNGIDVKAGDVTIDTGRLTVGAPTGPTPIVGGVNAQDVRVNGTPLAINPTPIPTCPAGQYYAGAGYSCVTPVPTPPQATAIPTCTAGQYYAGLGYSCVTPVPTPAQPTPAPTCASTNILEGTGAQGVQCSAVNMNANTPISGQVLQASSGSAASWQTITGTSLTLITDTVLGSSAANVTFSSISGSYKHLIVDFAARSDRAVSAEGFNVQFNADTGANYDESYMQGNGATVSASEGFGGTFDTIGVAPGASSSSASQFGQGRLRVVSYASTTPQKNMQFSYGYAIGTTGGGANIIAVQGYAVWRNTAAITSMKFFPNVGPNFVTGTRFTLYGEN